MSEEIQALQARIRALEETVYWRSSLFYKAFGVTGFMGDFVEFGVYRGGTLSQAYWSGFRHLELFLNGAWDHASTDPNQKHNVLKAWEKMRFIGFDSFEGLPANEGPDAQRPVFEPGTYSASMDEATQLLTRENVDLSKVLFIKGFFENTCVPATATKHGIEQISIVHIDSDLYSSAVTALDFCTPHLRDGSVIIFDEWFQYSGNPNFGEQRAFREWLEKNPTLQAAELAREGSGRMAFVINRT